MIQSRREVGGDWVTRKTRFKKWSICEVKSEGPQQISEGWNCKQRKASDSQNWYKSLHVTEVERKAQSEIVRKLILQATILNCLDSIVILNLDLEVEREVTKVRRNDTDDSWRIVKTIGDWARRVN